VNVVATEQDGRLASTCGCLPDEVRVAGLGQSGDGVTVLPGRDVSDPRGHYRRAGEASPWPVRVGPQ